MIQLKSQIVKYGEPRGLSAPQMPRVESQRAGRHDLAATRRPTGAHAAEDRLDGAAHSKLFVEESKWGSG